MTDKMPKDMGKKVKEALEGVPLACGGKIVNGVLNIHATAPQDYHIGSSNYSDLSIQPWEIWERTPNINPWDADNIKRILRSKEYADKNPIESRIEDYNKIIHNCQERLRQLNIQLEEEYKNK